MGWFENACEQINRAHLYDIQKELDRRGFMTSFCYDHRTTRVNFTISRGPNCYTDGFAVGDKYLITEAYKQFFCDNLVAGYMLKYENPIVPTKMTRAMYQHILNDIMTTTTLAAASVKELTKALKDFEYRHTGHPFGYVTDVHPLADGLRAKVTLIDEVCEVDPWPKENPNLKRTPNNLKIKDVIFNDPATIVFWEDGTKTVVKTQNGEEFDPEKGLAMAISKKALGNKRGYYYTFKHFNRKYEKQQKEKK